MSENSKIIDCLNSICSLKVDPSEVCLLIIARAVNQQHIENLPTSKKLQSSNTNQASIPPISHNDWQQEPDRRWAKVVVELYFALLNLLPPNEQSDVIKHVEKFADAEVLIAMLEIISIFPELTGSIFRQFAKTVKEYLIWAGYGKITDKLVLDIQNGLEEFASQEDAILAPKINQILKDTIELIQKELETNPLNT